MTFWIIVVLLAITPPELARFEALCGESHPGARIEVFRMAAALDGLSGPAIGIKCFLGEAAP